MIIALVIIAHVLVCIAIGIGIKLGWIKNDSTIYPTIFFIPVFGILMFILDQLAAKGLIEQKKLVDVKAIGVQSIDYNKININDEKDVERIVPLEEAIVINESNMRRALLMDVIQNRPDEKISLLQKATMSDDTELTHYATTTIMEVQSGFEQRISELEKYYSANPQDILVVRKLYKEVSRYVNSKLLTGSILKIYQEKMIALLRQLKEMRPDDVRYREDLFYAYISMGNYEMAKEELTDYKLICFDTEARYKMEIVLCSKTNRGDQIKSLINEMKQKEVYVSSEGKKWFEFWE